MHGAKLRRYCVVCQGLSAGCPKRERCQFRVHEKAGLADERSLLSNGIEGERYGNEGDVARICILNLARVLIVRKQIIPVE